MNPTEIALIVIAAATVLAVILQLKQHLKKPVPVLAVPQMAVPHQADAIKEAMQRAQDADAKAAGAISAVKVNTDELKKQMADMHQNIANHLTDLKGKVDNIKPETHLHAKSISITAEAGRASDTQPANAKPAG